MTWLWIGLAFIAGTFFGVTMMCCFFIAGKEDRSLEKLNENTNKADTE